MDALRPLLERAFGDWAPGDVPALDVPVVEPPATPVVYLLDRPGLPQSTVLGGTLVAARGDDQEALDVMDAALGGAFTARVNMNLREAKGWSYGAYTEMLSRAASGSTGPAPRSSPTGPRTPSPSWSASSRRSGVRVPSRTPR